MNNVFNTPFENSLRVILLLSEYKDESLTVDMITALDYLVINGKALGLTDRNLHGDNSFSSCEYTAKRELITAAITDLVLKGLIVIDEQPNGFTYRITDNGANFADTFSVDYAREYIHAITLIKPFSNGKSEQKLIEFIHDKTIGILGEYNE